jgi:hypothetical protein
VGKGFISQSEFAWSAPPFRSIEITGRSYFFTHASCLHLIMCIILELLQKEKWPFLVCTACGQKLEWADLLLPVETETIHGNAHTQRAEGRTCEPSHQVTRPGRVSHPPHHVVAFSSRQQCAFVLPAVPMVKKAPETFIRKENLSSVEQLGTTDLPPL